VPKWSTRNLREENDESAEIVSPEGLTAVSMDACDPDLVDRVVRLLNEDEGGMSHFHVVDCDDYDKRCQLYQALGMTRGDAQGVVDAEILNLMRSPVASKRGDECSALPELIAASRNLYATLSFSYTPDDFNKGMLRLLRALKPFDEALDEVGPEAELRVALMEVVRKETEPQWYVEVSITNTRTGVRVQGPKGNLAKYDSLAQAESLSTEIGEAVAGGYVQCLKYCVKCGEEIKEEEVELPWGEDERCESCGDVS
jgi:hypothetical protein